MNTQEKEELKLAFKELFLELGKLLLKTMECIGMFMILVHTTKDLIDEISSLF